MKRPRKFPLKFEKAIIGITRKRTVKEAEKAFGDFYTFQVRQMQVARFGRSDDNRVHEIVAENIESLRTTGVDEGFYNRCRHDYAQMPRRSPRKKPKKVFDANGIPEVTKTPIDPRVSALLGYIKLRNS